MGTTWIGLDVECDDPRWKKINQLGDKEDPPHVTLAYLGKLNLSAVRERQLIDVVCRWYARSIFPLQYRLFASAYDMFGNGAVTVIKVNDGSETSLSPIRRREALVKSLNDADFLVDTTYPFVPHVTVGHGLYVRERDDIAGLELFVVKLFLQHNGERIVVRQPLF